MSDADSPATEPVPNIEDERLTWAETRALIRSDFLRLVEWYGGGGWSKRIYWFFQPNYQILLLYRVYRYLYLKGWRNPSRILFTYALYLTGAEIPPTTSIGPACLINHAHGIILFGKYGARLSLYAQCGAGGGVGGAKDVGGGPGYPVAGDDVVFGVKSMALGPIRIGDRVQLGPAAFLTRDAPPDAVVVNVPSKVVKVPARAQESADSPSASNAA